MLELAARLVKIDDQFWSERQQVNAQRTIFHQWKQLEASGCINNFRLLAGLIDGVHQGWFFADSDAYKWLEAASNIYATHPDEHLADLMNEFVGLLERSQTPDGYLFSYNQLFFPGQRWVNLQIEHELYCHGHLIEAGIAHYAATAQRRMLEIAIKAADLLVRDLLNTGPQNTCGHEEIELALLRLYDITHENNYLELACQFIERRGRIPCLPIHLYKQQKASARRGEQVRQMRQAYAAQHPEYIPSHLPPGNSAKKAPFSTLRWYLNALSGKYLQQHTPVRRQKTPVGHAVRFGYLETAVAMLYRQHPDPSLLAALEQTWEHMVKRRMYVTGGLGSLSFNEGFGNDYELDPELAYAETCAALASMFWNWQMALVTQEAKYSDLFEWQLYNAAAVGMGLSGENYLYNNPLECHGGVSRKPWYAVPCCPSNLSRTWASLGKYIYSVNKGAIWIHQYIGNQTTLDLGRSVRLRINSELPWQDGITIRVDPAEPFDFTLHLRLPSWCQFPSLSINGQPFSLPPAPSFDQTASGYDPRQAQFIHIQRLWSPGDTLALHLPMPIQARHAHPRVKGHAGKGALTRGPLVYCLESVDNPNVDIFTAHLDPASLHLEFAPDLLGGVMLLRGQSSKGQPLTAIPYHLWGNRGESQMTVWIHST